MSFAGLLRHSVSVERSTAVTGDTGAVTDSWSTVSSSLRAFVQPISGRERQWNAGLHESSTHRAFFEASADVRVNDRVTYGGATYLVTFVTKPRGHHVEAELSLE